MIEFKSNTPTIAEVYNYTYASPKVRNRFSNEERDIVPSKVKIEKRTVYKKNKEGKFTSPEERLYVSSESTPQYYPYTKVKNKKYKRQMKIRHQYDCIMCIQPNSDGRYDYFQSKIIWRVGSFKKWPKSVPQNKVAQIHKDTREKLERKYSKLPSKKKAESIKNDIEKIRKRAKYLCDGDYIAQEYGICGDDYWRSFPLQNAFSCLYGKCYHTDIPDGLVYPFLSKHALACVDMLLRKGIIKYK